MRVNTRNVIAAWQSGKEYRREDSIWTDGTSIFSYRTCLATPLADGRMVLNRTKYSATTSNKQSDVSFALRGMIACEVSGLHMGAEPRHLIDVASALPAAAERAARVMGAV